MLAEITDAPPPVDVGSFCGRLREDPFGLLLAGLILSRVGFAWSNTEVWHSAVAAQSSSVTTAWDTHGLGYLLMAWGLLVLLKRLEQPRAVRGFLVLTVALCGLQGAALLLPIPQVLLVQAVVAPASLAVQAALLLLAMRTFGDDGWTQLAAAALLATAPLPHWPLAWAASLAVAYAFRGRALTAFCVANAAWETAVSLGAGSPLRFDLFSPLETLRTLGASGGALLLGGFAIGCVLFSLVATFLVIWRLRRATREGWTPGPELTRVSGPAVVCAVCALWALGAAVRAVDWAEALPPRLDPTPRAVTRLNLSEPALAAAIHGDRLYLVQEDGVHVWQGTREVRTIPFPKPLNESVLPFSIQVDREAHRLVTSLPGSNDTEPCYAFDLGPRPSLIWSPSLKGHPSPLKYAAALSPDGRWLAFASQVWWPERRSVVVLDLEGKVPQRTFSLKSSVLGLLFLEAPLRLVEADADGRLRVRDLRSGKVLDDHRFHLRPELVRPYRDPDHLLIVLKNAPATDASWSSGGTPTGLVLYDLNQDAVEREFPIYGGSGFTSLAVHPTKPWVLTGSDGVLALHDLEAKTTLSVLRPTATRDTLPDSDPGYLLAVGFSKDGRSMWALDQQGTTRTYGWMSTWERALLALEPR